jgi:hypothetical protein
MVNWQIDEAAAAELDGMGVAWEMKHVEHVQINVGESRQNGARRQRLDESAVADYRDSMERGDTFPMIVVCKISGSAGYVIAGGNHRHAAFAELSKSPFPVMCCSVSAVQFAILSRRLNRTNGKRETRADRVKQAAELVAVYGLTHDAAAAAMDVSNAVLGRELRAGKVRQAIVAATGDDCAEVANAVILAMWPFRNEHNVLKKLAALAKGGISRDELTIAIREARALPTEAQRVQALGEKCEQRKKASVGGRSVSLQIAQSFRRIVTQLENNIKKGETCNMQMDGPELDAIAKRLAAMATAVRAMSAGRS